MWNLMEEHSHCSDQSHPEISDIGDSNRQSVREIVDKVAYHRDHCKALVPNLLFLVFCACCFPSRCHFVSRLLVVILFVSRTATMRMTVMIVSI